MDQGRAFPLISYAIMVQKIDPTGLDAYKPADVAVRIEEAGVKKAGLAALPLATLSVLAGVFIALGAAAFTAAMAGTPPDSAPQGCWAASSSRPGSSWSSWRGQSSSPATR